MNVTHLLTSEHPALHHRDRFDHLLVHLLVAEAIREELTLLSSDGAFGAMAACFGMGGPERSEDGEQRPRQQKSRCGRTSPPQRHSMA